VGVKLTNLFRRDPNNAECIGYPDGKTSMLILGELRASVNILVKSMTITILSDASHAKPVNRFSPISHV
jgi:hypothetical protein